MNYVHMSYTYMNYIYTNTLYIYINLLLWNPHKCPISCMFKLLSVSYSSFVLWKALLFLSILLILFLDAMFKLAMHSSLLPAHWQWEVTPPRGHVISQLIASPSWMYQEENSLLSGFLRYKIVIFLLQQ
jgi:hypothetical protein